VNLPWVLPVLLVGAQAACAAREVVPANWSQECVGRTQFALPDGIEVASNSTPVIAAEYSQGSQQPRFSFEDGEQADFSSLHYLGQVFVSPMLDRASSDLILKAATKAGARAHDHAKTARTSISSGDPLVYEPLDVSPRPGFADRVNADLSATILVGGHAVVLNSSGKGYEKTYTWSETRPLFDAFVHGLEQRPLNDVPHRPGVCLPHIFIGDDGKVPRSISTTYRLATHPDVTIVLQEGNAAAIGPGMDPDKFTAKHDNDFFWTQRYQRGQKTVRMLWLTLHSLELDGKKGESSFVELARDDGSVDYGFFAAARADARNADQTDLQLLVIRNGQRSASKGLAPMSKDEFLKLSETVAASIKRRPTSGD
jgi:hypothetical protein